MRTQKAFHAQHKCSRCDLREKNFFCNFSGDILRTFESLKVTSVYTKGSTIFAQGQPSDGVFMLCIGSVKLSTFSKDGKAIIVRIAAAGEILGLSTAVSDIPHQVTAEALEDCQVNFVTKKDFALFLNSNPQAALNALRQLSQNYNDACAHMRSLALSNSVAEKLARLVLQWSHISGNGSPSAAMKLRYTHEEIASMIGTTRETVTRLLKDFRRRELISISRAELFIHDVKGLETMAGSKTSSYANRMGL